MDYAVYWRLQHKLIQVSLQSSFKFLHCAGQNGSHTLTACRKPWTARCSGAMMNLRSFSAAPNSWMRSQVTGESNLTHD